MQVLKFHTTSDGDTSTSQGCDCNQIECISAGETGIRNITIFK